MPAPPNTARAKLRPLAGALALLCLLTRIPNLRALPIFSDEAIYLRWAQLVRLGHPWVSLCDPKPPLHFWLLAPLLTLTADPLLAARLLSVLAGVLAIPLVLLTCTELTALARRPISGRLVGILAAVLVIFCPFLAFYQRLATADALFVTESLAAVWLSLIWARKLAQQKNAWPTALLLALVLGISLLTRQGLSYTLCLLPPTTILFHLPKKHSDAASPTSQFSILHSPFLSQLLAIAAVALLLWSPYLLANLQSSAKENGGLVPELKRRILYQSNFTEDSTPRQTIITRNLKATFIPTVDSATHIPDTGWLFLYLTPPIYFASLLGLLYLGLKKDWRLLAFLLAWLALMLGPVIILGNVIYSRYVLAAVPPLLIAAAFLLADALAFILTRKIPALLRWPAATLLLAGLLLAPLRQIADQIHQPGSQTLTTQDGHQYLTGWTAGYASSAAIEALTQVAATGPIAVITDPGWGTPADAAWVYLSPNPNIAIYYTIPAVDGPRILTPTNPPRPNTYLLRKNKFLFTPPQPVAIPPDVPIYYITQDTAGHHQESVLRKNNPNLGPPISFYGMEGRAAPDRVVIFPIH